MSLMHVIFQDSQNTIFLKSFLRHLSFPHLSMFSHYLCYLNSHCPCLLLITSDLFYNDSFPYPIPCTVIVAAILTASTLCCSLSPHQASIHCCKTPIPQMNIVACRDFSKIAFSLSCMADTYLLPGVYWSTCFYEHFVFLIIKSIQ